MRVVPSAVRHSLTYNVGCFSVLQAPALHDHWMSNAVGPACRVGHYLFEIQVSKPQARGVIFSVPRLGHCISFNFGIRSRLTQSCKHADERLTLKRFLTRFQASGVNSTATAQSQKCRGRRAWIAPISKLCGNMRRWPSQSSMPNRNVTFVVSRSRRFL